MNRNFYLVVSVRFLFVLAVQAQAVLMGWQMYALTRDALMLGLIGLAEALPALTLAMPAGLLVDRLNPLRFYQLTLLISLASILISWRASTPAELFAAALLTGLMRAFANPSLNAFLPRIVPREQYKRSAAYSMTAFKTASVIGPGVAGMLLALQGFTLPYAFAVAILLSGCVVLLFVRYDHITPRFGGDTASAKPSNLTEELLLGARFVFGQPLLLSAMTLDMFAVLFGGVTAVLPIYADQILHVGPSGLGWLRAAPAVGAILTGLFLIRTPPARHAGRLLLGCVAAFGFCILVFGVSTSFWLSMGALALSGAVDSVSMVIRGAIVQLASPDSMRGRISAVNSIFIGSSNEIGEFESGVAARLLGLVPSVIFGGMMTLATVTVVAWLGEDLRRLDLDRIPPLAR